MLLDVGVVHSNSELQITGTIRQDDKSTSRIIGVMFRLRFLDGNQIGFCSSSSSEMKQRNLWGVLIPPIFSVVMLMFSVGCAYV